MKTFNMTLEKSTYINIYESNTKISKQIKFSRVKFENNNWNLDQEKQ